MREAARQVRRWIAEYQPQRADDIEIGISEWNIKVNEDRDTVDLINGLWSAIWVGAMFEEGIDFANQWDLTTYTKEGGHSAFYLDEAKGITLPKSQYWALWMWGKLMGNELVATKLKGGDPITHFVTRSEEGLQIMLINTSESEDATIAIQSKDSASTGLLHTFSSAEYFWDPHRQKPLWSRPPSPRSVHLNEERQLQLPPFSINVLELPWRDPVVTLPKPRVQNPAGTPQLSILLPTKAPADRPIEGWVVASHTQAQGPFLEQLPTVQLSLDGPAKISPTQVQLKNATAPFTLTPTGPGLVRVHANSGKLEATQIAQLKAIQERALIYWTFDNPIEQWNIRSTYPLSSESSIRPNQAVAAARLIHALPARDADLIFHFEPLPRDELPFENASGVIGKLRASHNLKCADPKARVNLILQSDANHWMPIGSIPLRAITGQWRQFAFTVKEHELLDAMSKLYAVRFQLQAEAPVNGDLYLDDLGFIFRTGVQ